MTLYFDLPNGDPAMAGDSPWREYEPSPRLVYAAVASTLLTVFILAAGAWSLLIGDPAAALACAVASLFFGHLSGLELALWVRPRGTGDRMRLSKIDDGSIGVTFGYSTTLYYWYASFLTLLTLCQLGLAVTLVLRPAPLGFLLLVAVLLGLGATATAFLLFTLLRSAPGRLVLTPDGVYHHGITAQSFIPWHAVRDIRAGEVAHIPVIAVQAVSSPETRTRRFLFGREDAPETMAVQLPWLAVDPALVFQALRYYHGNPTHQVELSYQAAVDRIRQHRWFLP
ncbi:hypothetical protein [Actinoplanes sp. NPDC051851]|uniref:hypothetical protein n=1 Tax=Actinoplanes sp. NPDC051851 TaxID=3154753 RepID=UPI00344534E7